MEITQKQEGTEIIWDEFKDLIIKEETVVMPIDLPEDVVVKKEVEESLKGETISDENFVIKEETVVIAVDQQPNNIKVEKEEEEHIVTRLNIFKRCVTEKGQEQEENENNYNEFQDLIIKEETVVMAVGPPEDIELVKEAEKSLKRKDVLNEGRELQKKLNEELSNANQESINELGGNEKNLRRFTRTASVKSLLQVPADENTHECSDCGKCFPKKYRPNQHQFIHSSEISHKCSECGKCFRTASHLNQHRLIHSDVKPHKCSECEKRFQSESNLNQYRHIQSDVKPYKCFDCGQYFRRTDSLSSHRLIHTGEKPHKCSDCGKYFRRKTNLNRHRLSHSDVKPHKCSDCGQCFRRIDSLSTHRLIHSGEKPHKCSECGKYFRTASHLKQHRHIHSDVKPHKCSDCGHCFRRIDSLSTHRLIHSGKKPTLIEHSGSHETTTANFLLSSQSRSGNMSFEESKTDQMNQSETRKLPPTKKGDGKKGGGGGGKGYAKTFNLSPELAALVGQDAMPRYEVVNKVWAIIKERDLYDPHDKRYTICDDALYKVIGVKRFRTFGMMKHLKNHFVS